MSITQSSIATTQSSEAVSIDTTYAAKQLPDAIFVTTGGATDRVITLPKIGSAFAPIGCRVTITKQDGGTAKLVTITPNALDSIASAGAGVANTTFLPNSKVNQVTLQAVDATNWSVQMLSHAP